MRDASSDCDTPSSARTRMLVTCVESWLMYSCAASSVKNVIVTLPRPSSSPKVAMPEIVTSCGSGVDTSVVSPTSQVAVLRRAAVDHDFVGRLRRASFDDLVRVEVGVVGPAAGELRRTVAAERVAVLAEDLAVALDVGRGRGDAVDLRDRRRRSTRR